MTLIKREDAIDELRHLITYKRYQRGKFVYLLDKIEVFKAINSLPSAESEWIPCSERLPKEEEKTYWVCTDTEYQCECRWTNNRFGISEGEWGWSIFDTPQYSKPIAWRPLPMPYREENEA